MPTPSRTGLRELIKDFAHYKTEADKYKKYAEEFNKQIKSAMKTLKMTDETSGDWHVHLRTDNRESVNKEMLLEIVKRYWTDKNGNTQCPYINTVEVLNEDALEGAIYNGDIPKEVLLEMDKARTIKQVDVLTLTNKKNKKGEK